MSAGHWLQALAGFHAQPCSKVTSHPGPAELPRLTPLPQVHIEPGHRHGSKVVFRGEAGSDSPDVLPGDLIFILEQVRLNTYLTGGLLGVG